MTALDRITGKGLKDTIAKTDVVTFRVSAVVKKEIQDTAAELGLTMTEYLCSIHALAYKKLK
jgi:DNA-directed RNA polymerase subunit E'/Rpb7